MKIVKIGDRGGIGVTFMAKNGAKFYQIRDRGGIGRGSGVAETSVLFCKKIQYVDCGFSVPYTVACKYNELMNLL